MRCPAAVWFPIARREHEVYRISTSGQTRVMNDTNLVVTCKNLEFHAKQNPFHGYRIKIAQRFNEPSPVRCDKCGKSFTYDPQDILEMSGT